MLPFLKAVQRGVPARSSVAEMDAANKEENTPKDQGAVGSPSVRQDEGLEVWAVLAKRYSC